MDDRLQELIDRMHALENELRQELQKKRDEFLYEVQEKRVHFDREIRRQHRRLSTGLLRYLLESKPRNLLTAPLVWAILPPALLLDLFVTLYQAVCFPLYGIPKVKRGDHIVVDRHYLAYLNLIERINCIYCGYVNGLAAYIREIGARTEQHWCPIKHARRTATLHSRYDRFLDYGDATRYRHEYEKIRRAFDDLRRDDQTP